MTVPHTSGTITLVKGSAIVNGTDTAWAAALIVGGTLYVNVPNFGAMALPVLTVDSNIKITAAIPWNGANGTYTYALVRDGAFERQSVENAVKLAGLLNEMRSAAVSALAGLTPAVDKLPYFGANGAGALADFPLAARQFLAGGLLGNAQTPDRLKAIPVGINAAGSLDAISETGWVRVTADVVAAGGPVTNAGVCMTVIYSATNATQIYITITGAFSQWARYKIGGAWQAWVPFITGGANGIITDVGLPGRIRALAPALTAANSLNDIVESGWNFVSSGNAVSAGGPLAVAGVILSVFASSTTATQTFYNVSVGSSRSWVRFKSGNVWSGWQLVGLPILGTVSQSAGVPTGAIIERGSNANGEYVRFADGTQICFRDLSLADNTAATAWTFPVAFIAIPRVSVSGQSSAPRIGTVDSNTASGCSFSLWSTAGVRQASTPLVSVIGRWF